MLAWWLCSLLSWAVGAGVGAAALNTEALEGPNATAGSEYAFDFGSNWLNFIRKSQGPGDIPWHLRVEIAKRSLLASIQVGVVRDLSQVSTFIDVGCGSGLFSLAAVRLGAKSVVSFDLQKGSVDAARLLWDQEGRPKHWVVLQGSVLDFDFLNELPRADMVFAWGSLHHTGNVQRAMLNVESLLKPGGLLHMALYSTEFEPDAKFWDKHKQTYVSLQSEQGHQSPELMVNAYVFWQTHGAIDARLRGVERQLGRPLEPPEEYEWIAKELSRLNSEHALARGMDLWTDARDGLGGWPNERLEAIQIVDFARSAGLQIFSVDARMDGGPTGFNLLSSGGQVSLGQMWHAAGLRLESACGPYVLVDVGFPYNSNNNSDNNNDNNNEIACWSMDASSWSNFAEAASSLRLLEDGYFLGLSAGASHKDERFCQARGRYSHETSGIVFMTSDLSDPNTNGRSYQLLVPEGWPQRAECIGKERV
ncbi:unnamed protein product [Polarella glacialis]|uniref:Methyltransferase domain-containing protein n=1 Tax=Polarella glacialis TaxID=89957 RepID=A0A813G6C3_POLGL|nr:unnamed protein product [Polarella glacialis]